MHCNAPAHGTPHALQHTATHCSTLKNTAARCNTLQRNATHLPMALLTHCNTLQHTATHCNTLQHVVTHCNAMQHTCPWRSPRTVPAAPTEKDLRLDASSSASLREEPLVRGERDDLPAVCCSVLQCVAVCCSVLQYVAVCCMYAFS